ncbi:MAG: hypothetical protein AAF318_04110 [Pseudomonadota bacterium]
MMRGWTVFKAVLALAVLQLAWESNAHAAADPIPNRYAIIVGNGSYINVADVEHVDENIAIMEGVFRDVLGVPQRNILTFRDRTKTALELIFRTTSDKRSALRDLIRADHDDAELYIYYVGHGSRQMFGDANCSPAQPHLCSDGYLLGIDTEPSALSRTGYSYADFQADVATEKAAAFPNGKVTIWLESCFSGQHSEGSLIPDSMALPTSAPVLMEASADTSGFTMFAAAGSSEAAYWDDNLGDNGRGVFTHFLAEALYGHADTDGDKEVSAEEAETYVRQKVGDHIRRTRGNTVTQTPELGLPGNAPVVLASLSRSAVGVAPWHEDAHRRIGIELEAFLLTRESASATDPLPGEGRHLRRLLRRCGTLNCARTYPVEFAKLVALSDEMEMRAARCRAREAVFLEYLAPADSALRNSLLSAHTAQCPRNENIGACIASADRNSLACQCLADPSAEGCMVDPVQRACATGFANAQRTAREGRTLTPLTAYRSANASCAEAQEPRFTAALTTLCRAIAADAADMTSAGELRAVAGALSACPADAVRNLRARADRVACTADFDTITSRRPVDHNANARFLLGRNECAGETEAATNLMRRSVDELLADVSVNAADAERARVREGLKSLRDAYESVLDDGRMERTRVAIQSLSRTNCASELWTAQQSGTEAALNRFVRENGSACPTERRQAEAALATRRCTRQYASVNANDARALTRFVEGSQCTAEVARARAKLGTLAQQCLDRASNFSSQPNTAIRLFRECRSTYRAAPPWVATRITEELNALERTAQQQRQCEQTFNRVNKRDRNDLSAFASRFQNTCPSVAQEARRLMANINPFDGTYTGRRGYTESRRRSPNRACLNNYSFTASISNGRISFNSDGRNWSGRVSPSGQITINRDGISRRPNHPTNVNARLDSRTGRASGTLYNGYCGSGFFELTRR